MLFSNQQFTEENISKIIKEVIKIDLKDNLTFSVEGIDFIRDEDDYGGFRIKILGKLENIRQTIPLDIATGDPVTPASEFHDYKTLYDKKTITLKSYNIETMIAEKIHTIFVRGLLNSRYKDFFDIYILNKLKKDQINREILKHAFNNTFEYRHTPFSSKKIQILLSSISENQRMKNGWQNFQKKNTFARGLSFADTIESCYIIVNTKGSHNQR
jgi:predicted nucleotidyltransferase component of viral defense system